MTSTIRKGASGRQRNWLPKSMVPTGAFWGERDHRGNPRHAAGAPGPETGSWCPGTATAAYWGTDPGRPGTGVCPVNDEEEWRLTLQLSPEQVEAAFARYPDLKAVFLTTPNYFGLAADTKRIAEIAHGHGAVLLVDEGPPDPIWAFLTCCLPAPWSAERMRRPRAPTRSWGP